MIRQVFEQRGNQEDVNTESLIKAIAPDFADSASKIILNELIPTNVDIVTDNNETDFAVYNTDTGKVTLLKSFNSLINKQIQSCCDKIIIILYFDFWCTLRHNYNVNFYHGILHL